MSINDAQWLREFSAKTILYGVACETITHEDATKALELLDYVVDLNQKDMGAFYRVTDTRAGKLIKIKV